MRRSGRESPDRHAYAYAVAYARAVRTVRRCMAAAAEPERIYTQLLPWLVRRPLRECHIVVSPARANWLRVAEADSTFSLLATQRPNSLVTLVDGGGMDLRSSPPRGDVALPSSPPRGDVAGGRRRRPLRQGARPAVGRRVGCVLRARP